MYDHLTILDPKPSRIILYEQGYTDEAINALLVPIMEEQNAHTGEKLSSDQALRILAMAYVHRPCEKNEFHSS